MGLLSRVRWLNDSTPPPAPAAAEPAPSPPLVNVPRPDPPHSGPAGASSLRDALHQLYAIRPSQEAFAEQALLLIAKGAGVKTAALLGHEPRGARVHLLAHCGLEPDAVQILGAAGASNAWDIPLRSLRNRRINVIEAAHENPFVPGPLLAISPRRLTIAVLPFFHASAPVGVVVLFSPTPRGFADGLLKALSQSLRVCALALSELPKAATVPRPLGSEPSSPQPNLLRGVAALKAELARLTEALEEGERQRATETAERVTAQSFLKAAQERAGQLEEEVAALRTAGARLSEIETQIDDLTARLHSATAASAAAEAQLTELHAAAEENARRAERDAGVIAELTARRTQLEQELQTAVESARQRGEEAAALHAQVAELAPRAAQAPELQSALAASEAGKAESEAVVTRLRQELQTTDGERTRLQTALAQASAALKTTEDERSAVTVELREAQARAAELTRTEQQLAAAREQAQALETERAKREQELDAARAALGAGGQELAASAQRAAARLAELEAERARVAGDLEQATTRAAQAEAERQHHVVELAALQGQLTDVQRARDDVESERARLSARLGALEQERDTAIGAAQQRVASVEAEMARVTHALDAARNGASEELQRTRLDAASTLDGLRAELADAAHAREELQRALAAAQQECAAQQQAVHAASAECARLTATAEQLEAERRTLGTRIETADAERNALEQAYDQTAARLAALEQELQTLRDGQLAPAEAQLAAEREARRAAEAALAAAETRHQSEMAELRDRLAAFDERNASLAKELEAQQLLLQSAEEDLTAAIDLSAEDDDADAVLDIDRAAAPEGTTGDELEVLAAAEAAARGDCILLDDEEIGGTAARRLAEFGHRVSALAPAAAASDALKQRAITCAAVNLAAPDAWGLVRHLRNGSGIPHMPLVAYALADKAAKGFWLGPVDFAILPAAQSDLAAILNRMAPKLKRIIAMSNDIDVMSDVRTQLSSTGISTAVVLDGRQALDLVPTIRPDAAVLHLSPSCADVFRAIAGLRGAEISREIPILFLLDANAQPREEAFLAAGVRTLTGRGNLAPDMLVDSLASAFEVHQAGA